MVVLVGRAVSMRMVMSMLVVLVSMVMVVLMFASQVVMSIT